ncbi:MAG TPA: DUF4296 domain-containing protein [Cyclobacteriaceae bacterium]|nr:DUF4296 domain-containing protein [Cyclobacteriaceae bacterium]
MKLVLILVVGMMTVMACDRERRREGVLPQAEMVKALKSLYIAEEHVSRFGLRPDSARRLFNRMEDRLFENMGITRDEFQRSFDYYVEHPDEWESVYSALVDSLNLQEQKLSVPAP